MERKEKRKVDRNDGKKGRGNEGIKGQGKGKMRRKTQERRSEGRR